MPKLIFLSRLAFICNLCYLIALLLRMRSFEIPAAISSTIIILGYLVAFILNAIVATLLSLQKWRRGTIGEHPKWLYIFNGFLLIVQIFDVFT